MAGKSNRQPAAVKSEAAPVTGDDAPKNAGEAKLRVMSEIQYVRKRGKMAQKYSFVRDTDVIAALRGPMLANSLILTGPHEIRNRKLAEIKTAGGSSMFRTEAEILFRLKFVPTGETEDVWVIGEGADNLDKSSNKAMSAARKYALILGFNLSSGDDPDQFDEEGRFGGGEDDDQHSTTVEPPATAASQQKPPKTSAPAPAPKNAVPANGDELHKRISDYDSRLASSGIGKPGELLAYISGAGVKAGYTDDLKQWQGPAIEFAVDCVREYEKAARQRSSDAEAERKALEAHEREKASAAAQAPAPAPAPVNAPSAAPSAAPSTPGPKERFDKRIAGMNASNTEENLNKFRERYSQDKEMTETQIAELERCYWSNVKRVKETKK